MKVLLPRLLVLLSSNLSLFQGSVLEDPNNSNELFSTFSSCSLGIENTRQSWLGNNFFPQWTFLVKMKKMPIFIKDFPHTHTQMTTKVYFTAKYSTNSSALNFCSQCVVCPVCHRNIIHYFQFIARLNPNFFILFFSVSSLSLYRVRSPPGWNPIYTRCKTNPLSWLNHIDHAQANLELVYTVH